jgi:mannose-6-phosphate isomerase
MALYPLKFKPRLVEKMWGGRKLESILGKRLPPGPIGESWEIYDFPPGVVDDSKDWISSVVAEGPLSGKTLHQLVREIGADLRGNIPLVGPHGQFPILIKFLDANQDLSVQVHPDDAYARTHPGAHLKSEAWYIVQANNGSRLLKGVAPGINAEAFRRAIESGRVETTINSIPVEKGDCYYLPSGTVHALGEGILAAEVQTPSDTTYRVFDFNRIDPSTGKRRKLHVEEAMQCIDFSGKTDLPKAGEGPELVRCEFFSIRKIKAAKGESINHVGGKPIIWMMIEGRVRMESIGAITMHAASGDTLLFPAALKKVNGTVQSDSLWLEVTLGQS